MSSPQSKSPSPNSLQRHASSLQLSDGDTTETKQNNVETNSIINVEGSDQYEERFRVDRRKLEQMLHDGGSNGPSTEAEDFFLEVMDSTNTHITWPSKLKKGAKSKKDPHIKVSGEPENVKLAKDKIMAVLDTKSNRVTLKMDVSHTEHSHVIGKGGNNIKRVMDDTSCHIHFPDSNRTSQSDKSNQVSIAGQPYGVECARQKIRELLPITFVFDVPLTRVMQIPLDQNPPVLARIEQQYNVTIRLKQRPSAGGVLTIMAIVRGTIFNAKAMKEATILLMEHLTGKVGTLLPISLQLEVAAQHHLFMIGRGGSNLQQIMAKTGAHIHFPDMNSGMPAAKGTIIISGSIDNVLAARERIIGCLPLVLMFDMKEDIQCEQASINLLMEKLDVFISVKPKPKQPSKSVIVKSIEENVRNIYEARRYLLGLEKEEMPNPSISRLFPTMSPSVQGLLAHNLLNIATAQSKPYVIINNSLSPLHSPRQAQHLAAAAAVAACQTSPNWLATAPHGILNPTAVMMIPTSAVSTQQNIHEIQKSMSQPPQYTIVKDLNENHNPISYNGGLSPASQRHINPSGSPFGGTGGHQQDKSPYMLKSLSNPASPQHLSNGTRFSPTNGMCAINKAAVTAASSPGGANISLANPQPAQSPVQQRHSQQPHVDLDFLTKTLKKDLNLNTSGAHLMKLHSSGSGADLRALQQRSQQQQQQQSAVRSPGSSRRSFSLSMSLNASRGAVSEAAAASMNGTCTPDGLFDKKALGIERLADRLLSNDRLMASANDRLMSSQNDHLMSSQNDRLMSSANRGAPATVVMKPPPGITQPPNGAVNPTNVTAALADYERKKVMATKAIEQEPSGETRNPTDFWSGLGFSRSMPESAIRDRLKQTGVRYDGSNMATTYEQQENEEDGDPWKDSKLSNGCTSNGNRIPSDLIDKIEQYGDILNTSLGRTSKQLESPPQPPAPRYVVTPPPPPPAENSDMAELFRKLNLEKYTDLFLQQEIDLATFTTLNEQDLKELGISTFGARRKMLVAITDLQKSRQKYFSPTPGSNNPFRSTSASGGPFPQRHDMISHSGRW